MEVRGFEFSGKVIRKSFPEMLHFMRRAKTILFIFAFDGEVFPITSYANLHAKNFSLAIVVWCVTAPRNSVWRTVMKLSIDVTCKTCNWRYSPRFIHHFLSRPLSREANLTSTSLSWASGVSIFASIQAYIWKN